MINFINKHFDTIAGIVMVAFFSVCFYGGLYIGFGGGLHAFLD